LLGFLSPEQLLFGAGGSPDHRRAAAVDDLHRAQSLKSATSEVAGDKEIA